ncbi:MAG: FUSC family protein [Bacteroidetes bacterium]|nr:FUSC family protein [Bacteroidota bacterium]
MRIILLYLVKCVIGIICAHAITSLFKLEDHTNWCMLSVLLVLAPDSEDSYKFATIRIKANLVAAAAALIISPFYFPGMMWISIAVVLAVLFCYVFGVDTGARSASVAVIIILMHDETRHWWDAATNRAFVVLLGCVIGLVITYVFHYPEVLRKRREMKDTHSDKANDSK